MLIKCPECGKEISDKAESCPNCGCPSSQWKQEPVEERMVKARQCSRCQKVFSPKLCACPECGYAWFNEIEVPESDAGFPVGPDGAPASPPQSQEKSKGGLTFWGAVGAIVVAAVLIVAAIVILRIFPALNKPAELSGDSKIAYEMILTNAYCFPYAESVRIEGGMLSTDGDMLFCTLSYKTPQGKKYTGYYVVYPTSVKEIGDVDSEYADVFEETNFLDIKQINVNLAESLG